MEADFSGWATKAGLKCSDGLTIMPDAFKHQDKVQVPLVWQHDHKDPENVLGHVVLENREEGVYCNAYFNNTKRAIHAKELVLHKDINQLSIWANDLVKRSANVLHGKIREVSLVLAGANPGALIDPVSIRHGDGEVEELDDEAIIYTGLEFEHVGVEHSDTQDDNKKDDKKDDTANSDSLSAEKKELFHKLMVDVLGHEDKEEKSLQDIYDSMNDDQKQLLHFMLGEALAEEEEDDSLKQDDLNDGKEPLKHDNHDDTKDEDKTDLKGSEMKHNVFEAKDEDGNPKTMTLSHSDIEGIVADATRNGSLKDAVEAYAISHGIQDIDVLFPEARNIDNVPELFARRTEWVADLLGKVKKSPFSRVRTMSADLTVAEARAKGYITGSLKKEEFFRVKARITTPQTVYKKQKLDRDDIVDITDFDVVVWLKGEMRLMLDEEIARAILVGDGRAVDDEDKIQEDHVRPIANDHELYTTTITVNIGDANSTILEALDHITLNRRHLRGTGLPTLYTTETYIARMLLLRDTQGRKLYKNLDEIVSDLRLAGIVSVELLEEYTDIFGVLVNPVDYTVGADKGGQVSMFDDFDIDYNQYKYLIETRLSGALTKLKSAMVVKVTAAGNVLVVPAEPAFDGQEVTITNQTGVVYRNADTDAVMNAAGSPYAVAEGVTLNVVAEPAAGYYFQDNVNDEWAFTGVAP